MFIRHIVNARPPMVTVIQAANFGPEPRVMICPYCSNQIVTRTTSEPANLAWLLGGLLCLLG